MLRRILLVVVAFVAAAAAWLAHGLHSRPSAAAYAALHTRPASEGTPLVVTFLGVSTLLVRTPGAALLVDGFFTRPGLAATALGRVAPDIDRIEAGLAMGGITRLDAVVTVHSHYDHAMDVAEVARRTGAVVVGSPSTAWIARGGGLDEASIRTVADTATMRFGDLSLTMVPSRHFPHGQAMGDLEAPLVPPARVTDYLEGGSFTLLFEHEGRTLLVQGSAGFVAGALAGRRADVAYLGVGLLGSRDEAYRDDYWREVVSTTGARRVVPIHWDDFTRPLAEPLVPLPFLLDDLDASMAFVKARAARDGVALAWPVPGQPHDPFDGLPR